MFRSQNKSKGKAGQEHDVAMCSARFTQTLTACESRALDDVREKAGLIINGIAPRIFKGKLSLMSQVEMPLIFPGLVSIPSSFGLLITSQLSCRSLSKPAHPGLEFLFTPAPPSDFTQSVMSQDLSKWREQKLNVTV